MNHETLQALKGSIEKWEKILDGTGHDRGCDNCPLCQLFNTAQTGFSCEGCPVMDTTGLSHCRGTPYAGWERHQRQLFVTKGPHLPQDLVKDPTSMLFAGLELDFLKSLLP